MDTRPLYPSSSINKYCAEMNTAPEALLWRLFEELNFFHAAQVAYDIKKPGEGVTVVDDMMKTMKELGKTSTQFPVSLLQAIFDFLSTVQNGQLRLLDNLPANQYAAANRIRIEASTNPRAVILHILSDIMNSRPSA